MRAPQIVHYFDYFAPSEIFCVDKGRNSAQSLIINRENTEMTDFSYSKIDGMFALYANTTQSAAALSEIMSQNQNSIKFLPFEFQSLKRQLKSAGYTLSKEKACKMTVDELLEALAA